MDLRMAQKGLTLMMEGKLLIDASFIWNRGVCYEIVLWTVYVDSIPMQNNKSWELEW